MESNNEQLIYELIDIEWHLDYDFEEEGHVSVVADGSSLEGVEVNPDKQEPKIERDAEGIPMGNSPEAFKLRQRIITDFWIQLKEKYPELKDRKVYNVNLKEYIYIVHRSFEEAIIHSASTYRSTKAFLHIEEILEKARPVARVATKPDDQNQRDYIQMLIMTCELDGIGRIKLVVGISRKVIVDDKPKKEEYATIALSEGQKLIEKPKKQGKKKKAPHK